MNSPITGRVTLHRLGGHTVTGILGPGGFGTVYRTWQVAAPVHEAIEHPDQPLDLTGSCLPGARAGPRAAGRAGADGDDGVRPQIAQFEHERSAAEETDGPARRTGK